jgi:lactate dehydrogenase-like 2-hydroxyacid dehydrogenase
MSIAYTSRNAKADAPYPYFASAEALAREVDFLVVITPGGAATRKLIDAKVLGALGKKGYLVNVARGSVVDEQALVQALRDGTIAGAGLDVFENEPNVPSELLASDNVVLTPHVGSATWQTRQAMADLAFGNLDGALRRQAAPLARAMSGVAVPVCVATVASRERRCDDVARGLRPVGPSRLVTGAGSGLGLAIARGLAGAGARVVLNGRTRAKLDAAAAALRVEGLAAEVAAFDVADPDAGAKRRRRRPGSLRLSMKAWMPSSVSASIMLLAIVLAASSYAASLPLSIWR